MWKSPFLFYSLWCSFQLWLCLAQNTREVSSINICWTNEKKWRQYFQLKNMVNIVCRITLSNKPAANHIWLFKFYLKWLNLAQNTKLSSSVALATFQAFNSHSEIEHSIFVESSTEPHSILENECLNHNKRVGVKGRKFLTKMVYII